MKSVSSMAFFELSENGPVMRKLCRLNLIAFCLLIFCTSFGRETRFRFAWLSDAHVGSSNAAADLEASVRDINATQDIAFVLLSGDITEMGSDAELGQAKAILDGLEKPYYIVPGNHDTKWSESGCTTFRRLFKDDRFAFEYAGNRFIGMHQGPVMKMGDGHFAPEDLRWFDSVLGKMPDAYQPLIFVTHYPLDNSIDNWYTVLDRLKRRNTQAVLVGHGHSNRAMSFEGVPGVMGRSNLRAAAPAGGYTIVEVGPDAMRFTERIPGAETGPAWHTIELRPHDYRGDRTVFPRPDFSINRSQSRVAVRWEINTGDTIASTPAIWKDYLVVGNASGTVYCLSVKNGKECWRFRTGSSVYATPDIADGKAVFGSTDKNIYCIDVRSGREAWHIATGAPVVGGATIANGVVYIGGSDRVFRAIELGTGRAIWEFKDLAGFVETKPLVYGGRVIFGAWDTYLYALNARDGSLAWKWSNGSLGILYSPAACWPVAAGGKVFVAAPDRYMTALKAATGKAVWRSNQFQVRETVGLSRDATRVYARTMNDTVVAFSASADKPEVVWSSNCGYGYDIDPSMPVEKDGIVFFGTKNGWVYALEGQSGTVRWKYRVGVTVVNTPVAISAKRALFSDLDGRVMLVGR